MDYNKDNQNNNQESNGHDAMKGIVNNSYLSDSYVPTMMSIITKTEKLVTALYMVTDCMENGEPMRATLRTLGVDMVLLSQEGLMSNSIAKNEVYAELEHMAKQVCSLFLVGTTVGIISNMNGSILIREFSRLIDGIRAQASANIGAGFRDQRYEKNTLSNFTLAPDFFNDDVLPEPTKPQSQSNVFYKGQEISKGRNNTMSNTKSHSSYIDKKVDQKPKGKKSDIGLRIARRNAILSIIKDKKDLPGQPAGVTIKDIVNLVKDVSEKTIQRELLTLVSEGVLKKEGDKRWSRYSIAS